MEKHLCFSSWAKLLGVMATGRSGLKVRRETDLFFLFLGSVLIFVPCCVFTRPFQASFGVERFALVVRPQALTLNHLFGRCVCRSFGFLLRKLVMPRKKKEVIRTKLRGGGAPCGQSVARFLPSCPWKKMRFCRFISPVCVYYGPGRR